MKVIMKVLAGSVGIAALAAAAPAAAQYYPGYGNPYGSYPYGGNPVGQVLNQVLGGGYGANSQTAVNQCANAVQARLGGGYGYGSPYGGYGGGGRVLGISRVEPRSNGGVTVHGVASSGRYAYGYGAQAPVDLTWRCRTDYRGFVTNVDINRAQRNYGVNYAPWNNDYSQYGYRRY